MHTNLPLQVWMSCVDAVHDAGRKDVESCATVVSGQQIFT